MPQTLLRIACLGATLVVVVADTPAGGESPHAKGEGLPADGWYRLTTKLGGSGVGLEGNRVTSPVHNGAAFLDARHNVTGQLWRFVPEGNRGYFRLKTRFRGMNECLEGNRTSSTVAGGSAFMDNCQHVSGQLWKLVPYGSSGYFRLQTRFGGDAECLQGTSRLRGGSFMEGCRLDDGQLWKLEPVDVGR